MISHFSISVNRREAYVDRYRDPGCCLERRRRLTPLLEAVPMTISLQVSVYACGLGVKTIRGAGSRN